jgi:hypothetical protein
MRTLVEMSCGGLELWVSNCSLEMFQFEDTGSVAACVDTESFVT